MAQHSDLPSTVSRSLYTLYPDLTLIEYKKVLSPLIISISLIPSTLAFEAMLIITFSILQALLAIGSCAPLQSSSPSLQVKSSSGTLNGLISSSFPNVRQFLGIPFALPPTGARRFLPPSPFHSNETINAIDIGPSCPQQPLRASTALNISVFSPNGGNQTEFFPLEPFSEDCLTLNIWAPQTNTSHKALPVFVWFFGGGFTQGGTNAPYFNPQSWVQRTQEHLVVTVNFRSNIFGFPNAAGLAEQNLALLDQRLALEWVQDNIAPFGGDPAKIVGWGESAGAIAWDYLDFAFPSDPIVSAKILNSGTALFPSGVRTSDTAQRNFSAVASALGCIVTENQLDCMRNVSWQSIEEAVEADPSLTFWTVVDERVIFENYTQQYEIGALSSVPAIIGTNQHELSALSPLIPPATSNATLDLFTNRTFLCTAAKSSQLRTTENRTTYRYRYDGNFSDISPPKYPGAYHGSELPLIFGTAGQYHGASSKYEDIVSTRLQDLWLEFAKDPREGLRNVGWNPYSKGEAVLIGDAEAPLKLINVFEIDNVCGFV